VSRSPHRGNGDVIRFPRRAVIRLEVDRDAQPFWDHFWFAPAPYLVTDLGGAIHEANLASGTLLGIPAEQLPGKRLGDFVAAESLPLFADRLSGLSRGLIVSDWEVSFDGDHGTRRVSASVAVAGLRDGAGALIGLRWLIRDITDQKLAQSRITYLAYHDVLTGLPNRTMFEEFLRLALARARRANLSVAVLFLDLDGFKAINDRYGHAAGDRLLRHVAARLSTVSRGTDVVGRIGGDEFAVLIADVARGSRGGDAPDPERVADRIREVLEQPFSLVEADVQISASIGVAVFPMDATTEGALLSVADAVMYEAKRARGQLAFTVPGARMHEPDALAGSIAEDANDEERATNEGMPEGDPVAVKLAGWPLKGGRVPAARRTT
jgi:diguanylate cyclase (GGDEF)-like protein/PAS domain S-box-containing protein